MQGGSLCYLLFSPSLGRGEPTFLRFSWCGGSGDDTRLRVVGYELLCILKQMVSETGRFVHSYPPDSGSTFRKLALLTRVGNEPHSETKPSDWETKPGNPASKATASTLAENI